MCVVGEETFEALDDSHYFFSLRFLSHSGSDDDVEGHEVDLLNYGVTFAFLEKNKSDVLDVSMANEISPAKMKVEKKKKEIMEERSTTYWTTLAPNVEDYSGSVAKGIGGPGREGY
ncbi:hypothetical protein IFM89_012868 [Coptis chinensis]|uniref:Uncharacterized protein n=1 Tax=Coptis chinensis TaxID=261450 RepID=A0A835HC82_9MAGN|nr:hypothetical protein IFM89_012868 [Coptis chinensis]